ncbi:MAG: hypothetical protein ACPG4Q_14160, partial [Phycisphaeraceae bacterium]
MPRKHSKKRRGRRKQKQLREIKAWVRTMQREMSLIGGNSLTDAHRYQNNMQCWDGYTPSSEEITQWVLEDAY